MELKKLYGNKKALIIVVLAVLGIVLMLIPGGKKEEPAKNYRISDQSAMKSREEKRLIGFLEKIEGVEKVSVMISYEDSGRVIYGYNNSENRNEMVIRKENGAEVPVEERFLYPSVSGVSVIYRGDKNKKITVARAVSSATGAEIHNIEVVVNEN